MDFTNYSYAFKTMALALAATFVIAMSLAPYGWHIAEGAVTLAAKIEFAHVPYITAGLALIGVLVYAPSPYLLGWKGQEHVTTVFLVFESITAVVTAGAMWFGVHMGVPISPTEAVIPHETMFGVFAGAALAAGVHWEITNKGRHFAVKTIYTAGFVSCVLVVAAMIADTAVRVTM